MKRESDIDKDSLSSQWQITKAEFGNNFSALGETMRGPMMAIMKSVGGVLQSIRGWIEANPVLVAAIRKTVAAIGGHSHGAGYAYAGAGCSTRPDGTCAPQLYHVGR